jgi:hypothetical protein
METQAMTWWGNNKPNFDFWRTKVTYKKALDKHEKEKAKEAQKKLVDVLDTVFKDSQDDIVAKPKHYHDFNIEPSDFIMKNRFSFWKGNIVKYASRAGLKNYDGMDITQSEITDLRKAIRYAEMRINQLEGKRPNA